MFEEDYNHLALCIRYNISQSLHWLNDIMYLNIFVVGKVYD